MADATESEGWSPVDESKQLGAVLVSLALGDSSWFRQASAVAALGEYFSEDVQLWGSLLAATNRGTLSTWELQNVSLLLEAMPFLGDAKPGSLQGDLLDACLALAIEFPEANDAYGDSLYVAIANKLSTDAAVAMGAQLVGLGEVFAVYDEEAEDYRFSGARAMRAGIRVLGDLVESKRIPFSRGYAVVAHLDWSEVSKASNIRFQLQMLLAGGLLAESHEAYAQCVRLFDTGFYSASEFGEVLGCTYYDRQPIFLEDTNRLIRSMMSVGGDDTIAALGMMRSLREGMRPGTDVIRDELKRQRGTAAYEDLLFTLGCLLPESESFSYLLGEELHYERDLQAQKKILDVARRCPNSDCFPFLRKASADGSLPLELNRYAKALLPKPVPGNRATQHQN